MASPFALLEKKRMSLLEICISVLIALVALTTTAPALFRARDVYLLDAAARDVAARLYAARVHSVTENRSCRLRVISPVTYAMECRQAAWEVLDQVNLSRGLTVTANAKPEFHPRGVVTPTATISVWDSRGQVKRVVVNVNGRIRIE